jgi:hypothetical protein
MDLILDDGDEQAMGLETSFYFKPATPMSRHPMCFTGSKPLNPVILSMSHPAHRRPSTS